MVKATRPRQHAAMGAWGNTAFESDAALDAVQGGWGREKLTAEGRAAVVVRAFLARPYPPHREGYGQEEAQAACEIIAIGLAARFGDDYWRHLPYAHAVEEEVEEMLAAGCFFSAQDAEEALLALQRLKEPENVGRWREQEARLEALEETTGRLRALHARLPVPEPVEAGPPLRPSALSDAGR